MKRPRRVGLISVAVGRSLFIRSYELRLGDVPRSVTPAVGCEEAALLQTELTGTWQRLARKERCISILRASPGGRL